VEPGGRNRFTFTEGTAARRVETFPLFEREATLPAEGRFDDQPLRMNRAGNMLQVLKDLTFLDTEQPREFPEVKGPSLQGFCDLLS